MAGKKSVNAKRVLILELGVKSLAGVVLTGVIPKCVLSPKQNPSPKRLLLHHWVLSPYLVFIVQRLFFLLLGVKPTTGFLTCLGLHSCFTSPNKRCNGLVVVAPLRPLAVELWVRRDKK